MTANILIDAINGNKEMLVRAKNLAKSSQGNNLRLANYLQGWLKSLVETVDSRITSQTIFGSSMELTCYQFQLTICWESFSDEIMLQVAEYYNNLVIDQNSDEKSEN